MVISVTDPELLSLTGGIVQGMSGSPIIQNGKLIGAVTHVFIQDSTRGYGILVENMLGHWIWMQSNCLQVGIFWTENSIWYSSGSRFCRFWIRSIGKILLLGTRVWTVTCKVQSFCSLYWQDIKKAYIIEQITYLAKQLKSCDAKL